MMTDPIRISSPRGFLLRNTPRVLRGLPPSWCHCGNGADREVNDARGLVLRAGFRISLTMPAPTPPALDDPSRHAP